MKTVALCNRTDCHFKCHHLIGRGKRVFKCIVRNCEIMPTAAQAEAIKMFSEEKKLDGNAIYGLLLKKKNSGNGVTISAKKISSYFPPAYTKQEIENVIYTLLEQWKNGREEELEHGEDTI